MSKNLNKRHAAVFGGSGFLGSHVADALSDNGYEVRIFDRSPSPYLRSDQEMIEGDLLDEAAVCDAVHGCQAVYNFAGIADIADANDHPAKTGEYQCGGQYQRSKCVQKSADSTIRICKHCLRLLQSRWVLPGK